MFLSKIGRKWDNVGCSWSDVVPKTVDTFYRIQVFILNKTTPKYTFMLITESHISASPGQQSAALVPNKPEK